MEVEKKSIAELRVIDLKRELDKRGLDKNGVKLVLTERLSKALVDEGLSPDTYQFEIPTGGKATSKGDDSICSDISTEEMESKPCENGAVGNEDEKQADEPQEEVEDNEDNEPLISLSAVEESLLLDAEDEPRPTEEAEPSEEQTEQEEGKDASDEGQAEDEVVKEENPDGENSEKVDEDGVTANETEANEKTEKDGEEAVANGGGEEKQEEGTTATEGQSAGADGEEKPEGAESTDTSGANLWVSNLSSSTKATDLKRLFSRHGKLVLAKIVTSARTPGARCYGYVTMANKDDAERCIEFLHRVELHSRVIAVEWAKDDATGPLNRHPTRPRSKENKPKKEGDPAKEGEAGTLEGEDKSDDRKSKARSERRSPRPGRTPPQNVLSFQKIKNEREFQRARDIQRRQREIARHRRDQEENQRVRDRERRQRQESQRLEKEKHRLRMEREKLEREKEDLLRLERDRQRLERERIEREREELRSKRKTLTTRPPLHSGSKRPIDDKHDYPAKRSAIGKDSLLEPPPPPRFSDSDRQRDRYRSGDKYDRRSGKDDSRTTSRYESSKDKNWSSSNGSQYKSYGSSGSYREVWNAGRSDSHWTPPANSARWPTESETSAARPYLGGSMYAGAPYGVQPSPPGVQQPHTRYADPRFDAYAHSLPVRKY